MNSIPFTSRIPSADAHPTRTHQVLRHLTMLAVAIGAVGLLACVDPEDGRGDPVIGHIPAQGFADPAYQPQIPDTVTAGVRFEVTFWTWGGGCMENGYTVSTFGGRSAEVTPYDLLTWGPDVVCTMELDYYRHQVNLFFQNPGTAEIVLRYSTAGGWTPDDFDGDGRRVYTVEVSPSGG